MLRGTPIGMKSVQKLMYLIYEAEHNGTTSIYIIGKCLVDGEEGTDSLAVPVLFAKCGLYYEDAVKDMESGCAYIGEFDPSCVSMVDYEDLQETYDRCGRMIELKF